MDPIGMAEMRQILALADELEISREAIQVPLLPEGSGDVRALPGGKIEVVVPADRPLESWLETLRGRLRRLAAEGSPPGPGG